MSVFLQVKDISKYYGATAVLANATAAFSRHQKIGMIGRNGAGKSTLCRIITEQEEADSGSVIRNSQLRLSYLEQHDPFGPEETVLAFLERYTGREAWKCAEIAGQFQLKNEILEKPMSLLPGGFRTRVKLTAMLLNDPNFLILDEPTNYLDLSTLILLENFLLDFNGGYLIVSHDREFLKRTCDHTLEVEHGELTLYPGGIEEYFEFKEENLARAHAYNKTVEKKREQLQDFVDRFRAKASTATRAKSKVKQIAKLKTIEIAHSLPEVNIKIPQVERKGGLALACEDLQIGYPERLVARGIHFEIERGSKIAILGDNGQGKTTFLRTVAGRLDPKAGSYRWGTGLKVAYYAQHVFGTLHAEDDVYTHLRREATDGVTNQDILNMAGSFLFRGDDVKKKISVLSGGERARLCLAGLLLSGSQVFLLDEPTNHLDFSTVETLGRVLKDFSGTVFFISHDRTFVNLIADTILEVKDGKVMRYPGVYEDYVYHLECVARHEMHPEEESDEDAREAASSGSAAFTDGPGKPHHQGQTGVKTQGKEDARKNKAEVSALKDKVKKFEQRIETLTRERDEILVEIKKNPFFYSRQRNDRLKAVAAELEGVEAEWTKLAAKLEALEKPA